MAQSVKFYRLGLNNPVSLATYESYKRDGAMVFAIVAEADSKGKWEGDEEKLVPPSYYIWANGIEYKVANADALQYVLEHLNSSEETIEQILDRLDGLDSSVNALEAAVAEIQDSYVKTLATESLSDYLILTPTEATKGEVVISGDLNIVSMVDASTDNKGLAEASDVKAFVLKQISEMGHLHYSVVNELPELEDADLDTIYLVKRDEEEKDDIYDEWLCIEDAGVRSWELLGNTALDLRGYATDKELADAIAAVDASLKDYVDETAEALEDLIAAETERAEEKEAELDSSIARIDDTIKKLVATDEEQEQHLSSLDASVDRLDASVAALEDKVLNGVVNSLTSDSVEENGYIRLTENTAATGDVELHLDADVQNHCDVTDFELKQGLASTQYVEDRFAWVVIEDPATAEESKQADGTFKSEESIAVSDSELETLVSDETKPVDIESDKEITIG